MIFLSTIQVPEGSTGELVTLSSDNADAASYVIEGEELALGTFEIQGNKIVLQDGAELDFESASTFSFTIKALAADAKTVVDQVVVNSFQVTNVDEVPVVNSVPVAVLDGAGPGTVVGIVSGMDPESASLAYTLDSASSPYFELVPLQDNSGYAIQIASGVTLDLNLAAHQNVTVLVSDGVNEVPNTLALQESTVSVSTTPVVEGAGAGTVVGTISTPDAASQALNYILTSPSASFFTLVPLPAGSGYEIQVASGVTLDYETAAHHSIGLLVSDGENDFFSPISVDLADTDDTPPAGLALAGTTAAENAAVGDVVGTLSATDVDTVGALTYTLVDDNGDPSDDLFEIVNNQVRVKAGLDYETASSHTITVQVSDGANTSSEEFTITIDDVNDNAPTGLVLSSATIAENAAVGAVVGTLSAADADTVGTLSYALVDANGDPVVGGPFEIVGNEVRVKAGLDYEMTGAHTLKVKVSDGVNSHMQDIAIAIGDVDDTAPTNVMLSSMNIDEDAAAGAVVGALSATDVDTAGALSYAIVDENGDPVEDDLFEIANNQVRLKAGAVLDHESVGAHTITVRVSDGVNTSTQDFAITIGDVNDNAPMGLALAGATVAENAAAGDEVGTLSAADVDTVGTLTYTLVDANGDPVQHNLFQIVGNQVRVKAGLDYETAGAHTIRVKVSDGVNSQVQDFTITVGDVNEAPVGDGNSVAVTEGAGGGAVVGVISATDPEEQTLTYSLDAASDALFDLVQNGSQYEIRVASGVTLDYENPAHRSVTVSVSDGVNTVTSTLTLDLADANDNAPTGLTLSGMDIGEDADEGDVVGTLSAADLDTVGALSYAIVDENGDPVQHNLFQIVGDEVRVKAGLDYEMADAHTIKVKVSDGVNAPQVQDFTITIDDVNDNAPTDLVLAGATIAEDAAVGAVVGTLSATDMDTVGAFTYALVDDNGDPVEDSLFEIEGSTIKLKTALDDAQVGPHQINVMVDDGAGHSYVETITVDVTNINEAPGNVTLAGGAVAELARNGAVVGAFSATDQDAGDVLTYRLMDDAGGRFEIKNGSLVVKNGFKLDFEQAQSHNVTVEAKDAGGLITLKTFTVAVVNASREMTLGSAVNDVFWGGSGNDTLGGGGGNDIINGGAGNDRLNGGVGNDLLNGGLGKDVFIFNTKLNKSSNVDTIKSFLVKDDAMWLDNAIFKKLGSGSLSKPGKLNKDFFSIGSKAKDKNDYIVYDKAKGALYYDADGSGKGAAIKFAQLDKNVKLTSLDFMIV
jgi:Ca2+-binding RTX toxin-like protein